MVETNYGTALTYGERASARCKGEQYKIKKWMFLLCTLLGCQENSTYVLNQPHTVAITGPESGLNYDWGEEIVFEGVVRDDQDVTELIIVWRSDKDGVLNEDPPDSQGTVRFSTSELSANTHAITLSATDGESTSNDWVDVRILD